MNIEKLFQVLVVGGTLLSGSVKADTNLSTFDEEASLAMESEGHLTPLFCNRPEACVVDKEGKRKVKEGFVCCWGTSCDDDDRSL